MGLVLYLTVINFLLNGPLELSIPYIATVTGSEECGRPADGRHERGRANGRDADRGVGRHSAPDPYAAARHDPGREYDDRVRCGAYSAAAGDHRVSPYCSPSR